MDCNYRWLWLTVAGYGLCPLPDAAAQIPDPQPVRETNSLDIVTGYAALLRQYSQLRMIPPVSTRGPAANDGVRRLEIDGLVVDETQTKIGRDFYDIFYSLWQKPRDVFNYTVLVQEQLVPNAGTRIRVKVNDEVAFEAHLQPRYDAIEEMAGQAVYYTYHFLLQANAREATRY